MEVPPYLSNWEAEGGRPHVLANLAHKARPHLTPTDSKVYCVCRDINVFFFSFTLHVTLKSLVLHSLPLSYDYKGSFSLLASTTVTTICTTF